MLSTKKNHLTKTHSGKERPKFKPANTEIQFASVVITIDDRSSQPSPNLSAKIDVLRINRTGTITILRTANVKVRSQTGQVHHLRALVDNCAQTMVTTLQPIQRFGIKPTEAPYRIIGVNQKNTVYQWTNEPHVLPKFGKNLSYQCFLCGIGKHHRSRASKNTNGSLRPTKGQQLQLSVSSFRQTQQN